MSITNNYLSKTYKETRVYTFNGETNIEIAVRPKVRCADGFEISVQASYNHYCTPRVTFKPVEFWNGYTAVECGFPNQVEEELMEYAEDEDPLKTVYGWVPVELLDKILEKHGGIVN